MKRFQFIITTCLILLFLPGLIYAQQSPNRISNGVFLGETPPLRDIPQLTPEELAEMAAKAEAKAKKPRKHTRLYENLENAYQGLDPLLNQSNRAPMTSATVYQNFEGQASSSYPPDCNGTVGPDHFMQTINVVYAIYSKSGTLEAGPTALNTLFSGVAGSTRNDGDPIVLYDEQADRWLVAEFSIPSAYGSGNDYVMVAVSTTNDPTGTWYAYSFDVDDLPDYEKLGVWRDGYYMATNTSPGNDVYVLERDVMLTGGASPQMVAFDNSWRPAS
ncbi:MAG: hypothetical protein KKA81_12250, partial [Bacteroidetes bacterium]|nr:hypothetical protein [Bacteroidota bacterium]